ncbi:MAG: GNAT family N-acetyltransferase [Candidatus Eremiobacteraeota bacterium]|nr:GNAT family N-acetyltransferase [Candidatus Eremiobacteraeota bacterium]
MMACRRGSRDDLPFLEELQAGRQVKPNLLETVRLVEPWNRPELPFWVAPGAGYALWDLAGHERTTRRPIARLWDLQVAPDRNALQVAAALLDASEVDLPQGLHRLALTTSEDEKWSPILASRGYEIETLRMAREVNHHQLEGPRLSGFRARPLRDGDRALLRVLAATNLSHTLPAGRHDELDRFQAATQQYFEEFDPMANDLIGLVAVEKSTRRSIGYILVNLEADGMAYLRDISVRPEYWGRYAAQFLVRAAENELVGRGYREIYADISADNPRSYRTAQRSLGFKRAGQLWGRAG